MEWEHLIFWWLSNVFGSILGKEKMTDVRIHITMKFTVINLLEFARNVIMQNVHGK